MEITLLVARLLLALVFAVAGAAKAANLSRTRRAAIDFGLPEKLAVPLGSVLPFLEILIALALLPGSTAWIAALAGLALLLLFAAGIAINLLRGRAPDCNCFGQLHSKPVSWSLVARDLAMASVAALIFVEGKANPGPSPLTWIMALRAEEAAGLALGVVTMGMMATSLVYVRRIAGRQSSLLATVEAMKKVIDEDYAEPPIEREDAAAPAAKLPVGAPAPDFSLASLGNGQITLEDLLAPGKPVLLIFVSPHCSPCKLLLGDVGGWERDYHKRFTVALLTQGDLKANQDGMAGYGASIVLLQEASGVAAEYDARWTPAAVLIGPNGRIAAAITYGHEAIQELVSRIISTPDLRSDARAIAAAVGGTPVANGGNGNWTKAATAASASQHSDANLQFSTIIGLRNPAPGFSLQDVNGSLVGNDDLLGLDTLLLFWDPKCPFCRAMSEDIAHWEASPPKRAPRLVFVSSGNADDVRAESIRFKSLFLHDPELKVGALFGTHATPSAVLIDSEGMIASAAEAGRINVLALAGAPRPALKVASGA
jgi:thiol-disulfide isomerase/thioredoxin